MIIEVTLDAGINIYSRETMTEEIDSSMWDNMSEIEREDFVKEIALQNVNWGYKILG